MFSWWWFWSKDHTLMIIMSVIERSEYDDGVVADRKVKVLKMMLLIESSKCWRWCYWSKGQSVEDDVADQNVKMLKMMLLIERSKWWRWCCWSKGQSAKDCCWSKQSKIVADRSGQSVDVVEDWRLKMKTTWCWKLPMIYRCVTLMMLMMSSISLSLIIVVVDVVVEYHSF